MDYEKPPAISQPESISGIFCTKVESINTIADAYAQGLLPTDSTVTPLFRNRECVGIRNLSGYVVHRELVNGIGKNSTMEVLWIAREPYGVAEIYCFRKAPGQEVKLENSRDKSAKIRDERREAFKVNAKFGEGLVGKVEVKERIHR